MSKLLQGFIISLFLLHSLANEQLHLSSNNLPKIVSKKCGEFFKALGELDTNNPEFQYDFKMLGQNSGHTINDLGNYHQCISNSSYNFFVVQVGVKPAGSGFIGLCSPGYCSLNDWNNETTWFVNFLPQIDGPNLSNYTYAYYDPYDQGVKEDGGSYFIYVLLGAVFIGSIAAIVWGQTIDKKPNGSSANFANSQISDNSTPLLDINRGGSEISSANGGSSQLRGDDEMTFLKRIAYSFDLSRNWDELTGRKQPADQDKNLEMWNGIRVICLGYFVFGSAFALSNTNKNVANAILFAQDSWWFLITFASIYAVDIFFLLSGFFAAYNLLDRMKDITSFLGLIKIYLYRFFRLWPLYVVIILFFWKVVPYFETGPIWFQLTNFSSSCNDTWWKNILLLDNLIFSPESQHCFIWGFYVAIDFQMFLFAPLIVLMYLKSPKAGEAILFALIAIGGGLSYYFAVDAHLPYTVQFNPFPNINDILNIFFLNPIVHWSGYFLGMYVGILYKNYKNGERNIYYKVQTNTKTAIINFMSGFFTIGFGVFFPRTEQVNLIVWPEWLAYTWAAIGRASMAYSVWLILLPCFVGYLKPLKNFLSWGIFTMLSKLVYCSYLIHFIVLLYINYSDTQCREFSLYKKMTLTLTTLIISFVISTGFYLLIERPITVLAKSYMISKTRKIYVRDFSDANSFT